MPSALVGQGCGAASAGGDVAGAGVVVPPGDDPGDGSEAGGVVLRPCRPCPGLGGLTGGATLALRLTGGVDEVQPAVGAAAKASANARATATCARRPGCREAAGCGVIAILTCGSPQG